MLRLENQHYPCSTPSEARNGYAGQYKRKSKVDRGKRRISEPGAFHPYVPEILRGYARGIPGDASEGVEHG